MKVGMEWADYHYLDEQGYFLLSRELVDIAIDCGKEPSDSLHWSRRFEYPWVYFNLQPFNQNDLVLDAGGGQTVLQFFLSKRVKEVYNLDVNRDYIDWINKVKQARGFNNVFPILGDLTTMPFPSSYFDKTICISVLEHLAKDKVTDGIEELIRVTKPQGKIAITMDIILETTDKQIDLTDFRRLAQKYSLPIPDFPKLAMIFRVPPYNFPFTVACILLEK